MKMLSWLSFIVNIYRIDTKYDASNLIQQWLIEIKHLVNREHVDNHSKLKKLRDKVKPILTSSRTVFTQKRTTGSRQDIKKMPWRK